jgi:hypothetical protein
MFLNYENQQNKSFNVGFQGNFFSRKIVNFKISHLVFELHNHTV